MIAYSVTSRASLDEAYMIYEQLCRVKDTDTVSGVLVGNKVGGRAGWQPLSGAAQGVA